MIDLGGTVYFRAWREATGAELWRSDGTRATTRLVKDIHDGPFDSMGSADFMRVGKWVYFAADDGIKGLELWKTKGTPKSTRRVKDIRPGPSDSNPRNLVRHGTPSTSRRTTARTARSCGSPAGRQRIRSS